MSLSYGEIAAIQEAWESWRIDHDGSPESARDFIDTMCECYQDEEEKDEIFVMLRNIEEE